MNITRTMLSVGLTLLSSSVDGSVTIQEASLTNQWSQPSKKVLQSSAGAVEAEVQYYRTDARYHDGSVAVQMLESVFVPETGMVWIGNAFAEQYFVHGGAIVGIKPSSLGNIWINSQTTKVQGTLSERRARIKEMQSRMGTRMKEMGVQRIDDGTKCICLTKLIGRDPCEDMRSAKGSGPPKLTGIRFTGDHVIIEFEGESTVKVTCVFDSAMQVVRLLIDGKVVYPKSE